MDIKSKFLSRIENRMFNTSYPLHPCDWNQYRIDGELDFTNEKSLSLYIHIPFCERLCSFCEYTRTILPSDDIQRHYLRSLESDISHFIDRNPHFTLTGFDIGGGTPTALSEPNFQLLMDLYSNSISRLNLAPDYEPSVEATFQTLSRHKIQMIKKAGINRVSLGVQSTNSIAQRTNNRITANKEMMLDVIDMLHTEGIEKVNLDFMYGVKNQDIESLEKDLQIIEELKPTQVTLYEFRTNSFAINEYMSKDSLYQCYNEFYDGLIKMGYKGCYGQNTFSINDTDCGLSSYLRKRMFDFVPYRGFGISAQSMTSNGISYNIGKGAQCIKDILTNNSYSAEYTYILPHQELLSKYIAISAYCGQFSWNVADKIIGGDAKKLFDKEIDFGLKYDLLTNFDKLHITRAGYKHYGALFSLFYFQKLK